MIRKSRFSEKWHIKRLEELGEIRSGGTPSTTQPQFWGGDIFWCTPTDVTALNGRKYLSRTERKITLQGLKYSSAEMIPPNSILMTSRATIGECVINKVPLSTNQGFKNIIPSEAVDVEFLYYLLLTQKQNFIRLCGGSTFLEIGKMQLSVFKMELPVTIVEQQAIANVLSNVDALIESLKQLIAKKQQIKQGMMQRLLRPHSGWKEVTLFELAMDKKEFFNDGDWIESEHITDSGVRLIQTGNIGIGKFIEKKVKKYIYERSFVLLRCKEIREGDLLISRLAEPAGRACILPNIQETKIVTSVDVTIFRPPASLAHKIFLKNLFSTDQWLQVVSDRSGGTTHKRISRGALGRIKIKIPNLVEQATIANILSDMDDEITALEKKLAKIHQIKQGMMNNLLTGKIRLVKNPLIAKECENAC